MNDVLPPVWDDRGSVVETSASDAAPAPRIAPVASPSQPIDTIKSAALAAAKEELFAILAQERADNPHFREERRTDIAALKDIDVESLI